MADSVPWDAYLVSLRAVIDDAEYPVLSATLDWELNAIPRCRLSLPVGIDGVSGEPSPVHDLAARLKTRRLPVRLYATLREAVDVGPAGGGKNRLGIPDGEFLAFEGDTVTGLSNRGDASARFEIEAEHWLGRLNDASVLSRFSHPRNPGDFTYGAVAHMPGAGAGGAGLAWTPAAWAATYFDPASLGQDLWEQGIKRFLTDLAKSDFFAIDGQQQPDSGGNDRAVAALGRIGGSPAPPLSVQLDGDAESVLQAMSSALMDLAQSPDSLASQTFWDVLVGRYAADYLFYVVPRIESALVAPVVAGYRTPLKTLGASDIMGLQDTSLLSRRLRGMVITSRLTSVTGASLSDVDESLGAGGRYFPSDTPDGLIEVRSGPAWTSDILATNRYAAASAGMGVTYYDAMNPPQGAAPDPAKAQAAQAAQAAKDFLDRYARAVYAWTVTQGRQAVVQGPVRFDVAPGSTLKVEPGAGLGLAKDALGMPFYGLVLQVSMTLDAEANLCGSGIHMGFCHLESEHEDDGVSLPEHPLYKAGFSGCGLVAD